MNANQQSNQDNFATQICLFGSTNCENIGWDSHTTGPPSVRRPRITGMLDGRTLEGWLPLFLHEVRLLMDQLVVGPPATKC